MKHGRAMILAGALLAGACLTLGVAAQDGATAQDAPTAPNLPSEDSGVGVDALIVIGPPAADPIDGEELTRRTEELSSIMRCPVCQGLSVADSPSKTAVAMKNEVRELLATGYTEEQVLDYFEKSYGEFVLLEPKAEGFNLFVWIAPAVGILIGLVVLVAYLGRKKKTAAPVTEEPEEEGSPAAVSFDSVDPELRPFLEQVRREVQEA